MILNGLRQRQEVGRIEECPRLSAQGADIRYCDEGISATNTKFRDSFNEMIEDALAGKIGLILTKSVSRFARNTVDTLVAIRQLKEKGVEVIFEKKYTTPLINLYIST